MSKRRLDPVEWARSPQARLLQEEEQALAFEKRTLARRSRGKPQEPARLPKRKKRKAQGIKLLAIGDSHAHPDQPNHRYHWLGRFARDHRPDVIWDAGDWWDLPSLESHSKPGSRSFEGARYWRDVEAGIDAMERFEWELSKAKGYQPILIRTLGNHENRISRLVQEQPNLYGFISTRNLMSAEFGWHEHPFLSPVMVEGVCLQHYFQSGVMGRAIGGENPAAMLLKKGFTSSLQGHSHVLDYCDRQTNDGRTIQAMHVGCYFDYDFDWTSKQVNRIYQRGLLLCNNLSNGSFDPEWWSLERIEARYG